MTKNKSMKKFLKKQKRLIGHSAKHVAKSVIHGTDPMEAIRREVQSKVDRAIVKSSQVAVAGRGAYGRGAYGRGSYASSSGHATNSLFLDSDRQRSNVRSFQDETGRTVVTRREYVTRVISPSTPEEFSNTSYSINPGLPGVFAWLSQIAANYDEYEFHDLIFRYVPVISQASTTGAMGTVIMAANYNAGAPKFTKFKNMVEYQGAIEGRICDPMSFGIECDPAKNAGHDMEYVRAGAVRPGEDIKSYDIGTFQFATSDVSSVSFPANTLLGHIYVEYCVRLGKPKLFTALGNNIFCDQIRGGGRFSGTNPFGDAPVYNSQNSLGGTMDKVSSLYTFPDNFEGTVLVKVYAEIIGGTGSNSPAVTAAGNIVVIQTLGVGGLDGAEATDALTGYKVFRVILLEVSSGVGGGNNLDFFFGNLGGGDVSGASLIVTQTNPLVATQPVDWIGF